MTSAQWQRVKAIFDAARQMDPASRASYILEAASGDADVISEVHSLLDSFERARDFIEIADEPASISLEYPAGTAIGAYRIVQTITTGGMGTVYQAVRVDDLYRKLVALKVARTGLFGALARQRFDTERQILAHLDHPCIPKLLDGGTAPDGRPYFVMDFIAGTSLDQYCDNLHLTIKERLKLFLAVCSAVQYAHENFVVHRDIKPSNILVTSDGKLKLLDFGIAALLDPETLISEEVSGRVHMMTPEFASPEQLGNLPAAPASDIWSLGVLLFILLTGRKPYVFERIAPGDMVEMMRASLPRLASATVFGDTAAAEARRTTPDRLFRELRGDLDSILLKALQFEPEQRYRSVAELASDIEKYLAAFPVSAAGNDWKYRARKFAYRQRPAVIAAGIAIAAVAGGSFGALREARVAARERARADERVAEVRKVANSLLFDVDGALRGIEGASPARRVVVARALSLLDNLARSAPGDVQLERELVKAYERAGDVEMQLKDARGAAASYASAAQIGELIATASPLEAGIRRSLVADYAKLSDAEWTEGKAADAVRYAAKGLAFRKALCSRHELSKSDGARHLASDYADYGYKLAALAGSRETAAGKSTRSAQCFEQLVAEKPPDSRPGKQTVAACGRTPALLGCCGLQSEPALRAPARHCHPGARSGITNS